MSDVKIDKSWWQQLSNEFAKEYMQDLLRFIEEERSRGKVIYPPPELVFNAFNQTPFSQVKAVIIGQDPYHGPNQANGLSFSVQKGVKIPPSLKNIYKELSSDLGYPIPVHGSLESWAKQGVLLLNAVLTVEKGKPGSHRNLGWEKFTNKVIQILNDKKENLVFFLWGADAKKKASQVDKAKHLVLESAHPSPFSAKKFFNNKHFSQANKYLEAHGKGPIDWQIL